MALSTSLTQAIDSRGTPFAAIRPSKSWITSLSGAGTFTAGPFMAQTRVVRIVAGANDIVRVVFNQIDPDPMIIARGIYQDFIVQPGDTITLSLDPASANGNASIVELGGSPPVLPLDIATGAVGAYGLRRLGMTYTGAAVRVRRASDNATLDIGFVGNDLDVATLNAFIAGTQAFVTRWFDQTGFLNGASNNSAANQPQLIPAVAALNNKPAIQFGDAGATSLTANAMGQVANIFSAGGWWSFVANFGAATQPDHLYNKAHPSFHLGAAGTNTFVFGQNASTSAGSWTTPAVAQGSHVFDIAYNSSSNANVPVIAVDGTTQSLTSVQPVGTINSDAANGISIGNNVSPTGGIRGWAGYIAEILTYASQPTPAPVRLNQKAYWGTP